MGDDDEEDEADAPTPAPASSKSKKKQKMKEKAAKSAFSELLSDDDEPKGMPPAEEGVNLVTAPVDSLASIEQVTTALAATVISKTRKQSLKQRLKKLEARYTLCSFCCVPSWNYMMYLFWCVFAGTGCSLNMCLLTAAAVG